MRALIIIAGLLTLGPPTALGQWPDLTRPKRMGGGQKDAALIVAIEDYANISDVHGARENARAWEAWFRARKVPVIRTLLDAQAWHSRDRQGQPLGILVEARAVAQRVKMGGTLWFVFIGHGMRGGDPDHPEPALLDQAITGETPENLVAKGILVNTDLLPALDSGRGRKAVVVLDACFSGKDAEGQDLTPGLEELQLLMKPGEIGVSRRIATEMTVLSAGHGKQYAGPLPGVRRPAFSYLVLGGLWGWADGWDGQAKDGHITGAELVKYADEVLFRFVSGRRQQPQARGKTDQPLVLATQAATAPNLDAIGEWLGKHEEPTLFPRPSLPAVPKVELPAAPPVRRTWDPKQVAALEALDKADRFDRLEDESPEKKIASWQTLAQQHPTFAADARARIDAWTRFIRQKRERARILREREVNRDKEWSTNSRLLPLGVVPFGEKRKWARAFVDDYGDDPKQNPYVTKLRPYLWVRIEPGTFLMGSPDDEPGRDDDEKQHTVKIKRAFELQQTEVTQSQWLALMDRNPSRFPACGGDCPVERVNWYEAVAYANALSKASGLEPCYRAKSCRGTLGGGCEGDGTGCNGDYVCEAVELLGPGCTGYRLPTEAEWEYAARAGTTSALYTGPIEIKGTHNAPALDPIAWYGGNSGVTYDGGFDCSGWSERQHDAKLCGTHPVAFKAVNPWGLYDMLGNVWEWTWDATGVSRVYRGGSWYRYARYVRAAGRGGYRPSSRYANFGFRLARSSP